MGKAAPSLDMHVQMYKLCANYCEALHCTSLQMTATQIKMLLIPVAGSLLNRCLYGGVRGEEEWVCVSVCVRGGCVCVCEGEMCVCATEK